MLQENQHWRHINLSFALMKQQQRWILDFHSSDDKMATHVQWHTALTVLKHKENAFPGIWKYTQVTKINQLDSAGGFSSGCLETQWWPSWLLFASWTWKSQCNTCLWQNIHNYTLSYLTKTQSEVDHWRPWTPKLHVRGSSWLDF